MVRMEACLTHHRSREEQLEQRLMEGSRNVGEGWVQLIEYVPLEVGQFFSQPALPQDGGVVATSDSLE
jgi:hypothetical protein